MRTAPPDVTAWRKVVEEAVSGIADERMQRRAWFGLGPEVASPDETFNQFFDDAAIEEILARGDTELNEAQITAGKHLVRLMQELADQTPNHIEPSDIIDDPRWKRIREAAAGFAKLLAI